MSKRKVNKQILTETKTETESKKAKKRQASFVNDDLKKLNLLDSIFLVSHPIDSISELWAFAKSINSKLPCDAFKDLMSVKLVGLFSYLNGDVIENVLISHRFATDLPEMQTVMVYEKGRFCYWRDSPKDQEPILIHVSNSSKHFPAIEIVGNSNLFCALHFLTKQLKENFLKFFPSKYDSAYFESTLKNTKKKRSKESIGSPFHGLGIKVIVRNDVGYRTVTDNLKRLKTDIETMGTTTNAELKQKLRSKFLELHSCIQYANDEKDFGMGLEFGHDLFMSNYECFDGLARNVLKHAYELLERQEFCSILDAHYERGRRSSE